MVFPVVGGDGKPTGYEISNSLRFNNPDDPNLSTTFGSAGNRRTFTISAWVKRGNIADDHTLFGQGGTSSGNPRGVLFFANSLRFTNNTSGSSTDTDVETNAKTRDPSAWYHAVVAVDTTQGTNSNRVKLYLNGELQTSLATTTYPDQNFEMGWNNNVLHTVGRYPNNDAYHMDGYISEFYFIDGTQYAASDFGETNDNGVWIPKDAKGDLTFGTNGFYLEFQQTGTGTNASGMGADTSGNDNHLAVNNLAATDVTVDTPTNNFATLNSLSNFEGSTLSEGNTKAVTPSSSTTPANKNGLVPATMGVQNGKWYWEVKVPTTNYVAVGIIADDKLHKAYLTDSNSSTRIVKGDDGTKHSSNSAGGNYMAAYEGSILQVALNLDDGEITFGAGGSWANGSGSTNQTFANSTAAYTDLNSSSDFTNKFILPVVSDENQGTSDTFEMNFGNPPFSISSSNADANGYGSFEYAVPSGFYSLCTKNLAEYG
jgi:hypothetical protein